MMNPEKRMELEERRRRNNELNKLLKKGLRPGRGYCIEKTKNMIGEEKAKRTL
jgi:hypothetical protein